MNLIYDVDLVPSLCRRVIDLFTDLTDIIHTIIRCSVDLYDIHSIPGSDSFAGSTFPTRAAVYRVFTIDRFRKYLCYCRFTGSTRTAKEVRMSDPICFYLVFQCRYDVLLPFDILKFIRTELSI